VFVLRRIVLLVGSVIVLLAMAVPARAATAQVTCTTESGKVVLTIRASDHAGKGLAKMVAATDVAQAKLGVTCESSTGERVTVHHEVKIVCSNRAGDAVLRLKVNKHALKGMDVRVKALARRVGNQAAVGCDVRA
jgi:hypothetical protein